MSPSVYFTQHPLIKFPSLSDYSSLFQHDHEVAIQVKSNFHRRINRNDCHFLFTIRADMRSCPRCSRSSSLLLLSVLGEICPGTIRFLSSRFEWDIGLGELIKSSHEAGHRRHHPDGGLWQLGRGRETTQNILVVFCIWNGNFSLFFDRRFTFLSTYFPLLFASWQNRLACFLIFQWEYWQCRQRRWMTSF